MDVYIFKLKHTESGRTEQMFIGTDKDQTLKEAYAELDKHKPLEYILECRWPRQENKGPLLTKEIDLLQEAALYLIHKAKKEGKCHSHLRVRWEKAIYNYAITYSNTPISEELLQKNSIEYGLEAVLTEYQHMGGKR